MEPNSSSSAEVSLHPAQTTAASLVLDALAEGLARLEVHVILGLDRDGLASGGVAALAGTPMLRGKGAEARDGDLLASVERGRDQALPRMGREDHIDDLRRLALADTGLLR